MDVDSRRRKILSTVETQGTVRVSELARQFDVTEMTIRRDLSELECDGLVKRVHGGGVSARGRNYEPTLMLRRTQQIEEKKRIGNFAAGMVEAGDFIALDVGTTTFEVARSLVGRRNLTVITPSLLIANVLINQPDIRLIIAGGVVRAGETSLIGELCHSTFEKFHVDRLFLCAGGIDAEAGLTEYNWDDAMVKQAMIKAAKEVILVADSTKFDRIASVNIAPLHTIQAMITDQTPKPPLLNKLEEAGVKIFIANPDQ